MTTFSVAFPYVPSSVPHPLNGWAVFCRDFWSITDARLNTAHFYIRTDEKGTFEDVLAEVKKKIAKEAPEVEIVVASTTTSRGIRVPELPDPKKIKHVPKAGINAAEAKVAIDEILNRLHDYRQDEQNTVGQGSRIRYVQKVGDDEEQEVEWVDVQHSNRVTARWIFLRELEYLEPRAKTLCKTEDKKLDARIEYNSIAADSIRRVAQEVAKAYLQRSEIKVKSNEEPYTVQEMALDLDDFETYKYALHARYSGLNNLEKKFALALDKKRKPWARNPTSGYSLPLLSEKGRKFSPDFLVWVDKDVIAIDTKGDHLIENEADRKLLLLTNDGKGTNLHIRLVTDGEWGENYRKKPGGRGMTVWVPKHGRPQPIHCMTAEDAASACLII